MAKITQAQVLKVYTESKEEALTSTIVAERLNAPENAVRAAISWLLIGNYLESCTDKICRLTKKGDLYIVGAYKWTGKATPIAQVRQNPEERNKTSGMNDYSLEYAMSGWQR